MAEFSELIKRFDKIRDYMRDFYVYGFKSREDFTKKSTRTYDNEKRRCESYVGQYMKWVYSSGNKTSFISVDCANIPMNPLYGAWKSKSFTANDIMLHFYVLSALAKGGLTVEKLTDVVSEESEIAFEAQTVRNKCNEYFKQGLLTREKVGKAFVYSIPKEEVSLGPQVLNAVKFFQGAAPFGEVGSYILDSKKETNELFTFKHYYIAHTLENGILYDMLSAIRQGREIRFNNYSERSGQSRTINALPLKILVSTTSGRRFIALYSFELKRFTTFRLDYIKSVTLQEPVKQASELREKLENTLHKAWGVSFGGYNRYEVIAMKLFVNEQYEQYLLERVHREGQGGTLTRLEENIFLYTKEILDSNDMTPWIKTFIGRVIGLEGTNESVVKRFYSDLEEMAGMYGLVFNKIEG
jgi:predicted DNA-binding transcriptional regulator